MSQNGRPRLETMPLDNERVGAAIEMAEMYIPKIMTMRERQNDTGRPAWASFLSRIPGLRKFQSVGRPPDRMSKKTWGGRHSPQIFNFLDKFGAVRYDRLDWETLNIMRRNPIVKLAYVVRASPIFTALREVGVECDDPAIKAFVQSVFVDRWLLRVANSSVIPSYVYGSAPHEKVWQNEVEHITYIDEATQEERVAWDGPALTYRKIDLVMPETLDGYLTDKNGDFAGFVQSPRNAGGRPITVPASKAFVLSNRFIYGGFWGESESEDGYASWYYASFFRALLTDYMRLRAISPIVGHAPVGTRTTEDGEEIDNLSYAGEMLYQAFTSQVIVLPWEPDPLIGQNQWGYSELKQTERVELVFIDVIEELEVNILRGALVPERTVTQNKAAVGSYNQAEIHQERLLDMTKTETDQFIHACNRWLIPQLVEDNFGANAPRCLLSGRFVSEALKQKLFNVLITLLQNDTEDSRVNRSIAIQDLLKFLDVPFLATSDETLPEVEDEESTPAEEEAQAAPQA